MDLTAAIVLPLLIGVIAGLRAMTAPAAISLAARAGWVGLTTTSLAFLGYAYTPWIFTALALVELVTDQLPTTPSRTVPVQFGTRILMGGLTGGAIGVGGGALIRLRPSSQPEWRTCTATLYCSSALRAPSRALEASARVGHDAAAHPNVAPPRAADGHAAHARA